MLTDFGIALAVQEAGGNRLTETGLSLGTPQYMSPEQSMAERELDGRTDIYALGCVLYEMLAGEPPYTGPTNQAIIAKRINHPVPSVRTLRETVPESVDRALMSALAKAPADRFATGHQFAEALATGGRPADLTPTVVRPVPHPARRFTALTLISALIVLGALAAWLIVRRPLTLTTSSAIAVTSEPGIEYQPALSPDGSQVAFVAQRGGRKVVTVRSAIAGSGGELRPADATPGTQEFPSWSPDGEFIRFFSCTPDGCLWREVGRLGGTARLVELPRQTPWTAWSRDGTRAALGVGDSIFVYTVADRSTRSLAVEGHPSDQHSLAWSPDGRWIAYVNNNGSWPDDPNTLDSSIWIVAAASGKRVAVTAEDHLNVSPVWLDANHLLFISNRDGPREVYVVEVGSAGARGDPQKVAGGTDAYSLSLSADGTRLAVARYEVRQNVWAFPIRASGSVSVRDGRPVTSGTQVVETHEVSPDGQWLAYDSNLRGNADLYKLRLDGGEPIPLVSGPADEFEPRWSPDGREVAFYQAGASVDVFVVSAEGGTPAQLTNEPGFDGSPRWSPDGLRIAFHSDRTGKLEVWLLARDRVGGPWRGAVQLTNFGCGLPQWAPDGRGVLCLSDTTLVLVSGTGAVLWRRDPAGAGFSGVSQMVTFSEDGLSLYLSATRGGRRGIWTWPLAGGEPRLLVSFDDPPLVQAGFFSARGDRLYLTVAQNESDIWVMDLKR